MPRKYAKKSKPASAEKPAVRRTAKREAKYVFDAEGTKPVDPGKITWWERGEGNKAADRVRLAQLRGYEQARAEDVEPDHQGYVAADGSIRKGDLVLMIGSRDRAEEAEVKRMRDQESQERSVQESLNAEAHAEIEGGHGQRRGGKFISIA